MTELNVVSSVNDRSKLNATIAWSSSDGCTNTPDKWQVYIENLTWIQNDFPYHEWIYDVNASEYLQLNLQHSPSFGVDYVICNPINISSSICTAPT